MSVKSIRSMVLINSEISWLFCLNDLPISDRSILKFPTTIVLGSIYATTSKSVCLVKLCAPVLGTCMLKMLFLLDVPFCLLIWSDLLWLFWLILVRNPIYQIWIYLLLTALRIHFYNKPIFVLIGEMNFL
jgi:hypothetical protein